MCKVVNKMSELYELRQEFMDLTGIVVDVKFKDGAVFITTVADPKFDFEANSINKAVEFMYGMYSGAYLAQMEW